LQINQVLLSWPEWELAAAAAAVFITRIFHLACLAALDPCLLLETFSEAVGREEGREVGILRHIGKEERSQAINILPHLSPGGGQQLCRRQLCLPLCTYARRSPGRE
jgi:hypothetical protein